MINRDFSPEFINSVVNHPDVLPWVAFGDQRKLDLTHLFDDKNVVLTTEHGGFVFVCHGSGLYEVHTQFLEGGRGRHSLLASKEAARYMFAKTDCNELVTKVPSDNVAARKLTKVIGFEYMYTRQRAFKRDNRFIDVDYYSLPIRRWVCSDDSYIKRGKWFHDKLGDSHVNHDEDEAHDRFVGASVEMALNGQIVKGVNFYNRWACLAGYELAHLIEPDLIDIHECKLRIKGNNFEVIPCQ